MTGRGTPARSASTAAPLRALWAVTLAVSPSLLARPRRWAVMEAVVGGCPLPPMKRSLRPSCSAASLLRRSTSAARRPGTSETRFTSLSHVRAPVFGRSATQVPSGATCSASSAATSPTRETVAKATRKMSRAWRSLLVSLLLPARAQSCLRVSRLTGSAACCRGGCRLLASRRRTRSSASMRASCPGPMWGPSVLRRLLAFVCSASPDTTRARCWR